MLILKRLGIVLLLLIGYFAFILIGVQRGFLLTGITSEDTPEAFVEATQKQLEQAYVGNLAMLLVEEGKVSEDFFYATEEELNQHSVFQVASVSKWLTSWGIMNLVEEGLLSLDAPVETYLTRWHLPPSEFDHDKVTIRRVLSHSSGLTDDLGYDGFGPDDTVQTLEESLTQAADAYYADGAAKIGYEPGSRYMYSGAGYTLLQLIIEEVTQMSFQDYMTEAIFQPLGMMHSTFVIAERPDLQVANLYNEDGSTSPPNLFTALAAASLFTCTEDLGKFLVANVTENPVLDLATVRQMGNPEAYVHDTPVYGLGPHLYSQNDAGSLIIGHDGSSGEPVINTAARIDLVSKNGIVVLQTGNSTFGSYLSDEWIFMKFGIADFAVISRNIPYLIRLAIGGALAIIVLAIFWFRMKGKRREKQL